MSIGAQIAAARALKRMDAKRLAELAGIHPTYLSRLENGHAPGLKVDVLLRICKILDTEPNVILEWHKDREGEPLWAK